MPIIATVSGLPRRPIVAHHEHARHGLLASAANATRVPDPEGEKAPSMSEAATGNGTSGRPRGGRLANLATALVSLCATVLAIEIGYRLVTGLPLLELANWRGDHTVILESGDLPKPDPQLGWVPRSDYRSPYHNTLAHGIRRNFDEAEIRTGHILAVGDSFTEGWEVGDSESWPAYLEKLVKKPVVNGGVGGYGTDQIILRTEQLLPIVKPKVLIVGFLEFDIFRAGHTHFGSPKPWFAVESGALKYQPPALVTVRHEAGIFVRAGYWARHWLGYLASFDYLLRRATPDFWLGSERRQYTKAPNDPVQVTCLLLERLKKRTDAEGVRLVLFMQYYAATVIEEDEPTDNAQGVSACAQRLGIQLVDQFAPLRAIAAKNADAIRPYYMTEGNYFSHMSARGNEHAAQLLAKALGD